MYKLPNGKIVYPIDIECVHEPTNGKGGIYVGNLEAAENLPTLKKFGIKAVLTAAKGILLNHPKTQIHFQLYIPGEDHQRFDMTKYFNQSINFIRDTLDKTNILVHCLAGVSRSVSLVMAYFIKYHNMPYDSVYAKIKAKRKIIHPNDGFISQLRKFQCQCRQNGPVAMQRSEIFEMRSSYSPSKRIQRRGYEGIYASPQKMRGSPDKQNGRNLGYSEYDPNCAKFHPNRSVQGDTMKNPELYKSIVEDLRIERGYKDTTGLRHFSPDRYQKQNRTNQSFGMKRLSSMNVNMDSRNQNNHTQREDLYSSNYQRYEVRNRARSDFKPLDSIQNKQHDMDSEIDRKIAEIRKKYQQYTKKTETVPHDRSRLDKKYSNIPTIQEGSQNGNSDDLYEMKMRKMTTGYEHSGNDIYGGIGVVRNNNYLNEAPVSSSSKFVGSRLRRLQSYQV